jgi:hypothetical protein
MLRRGTADWPAFLTGPSWIAAISLAAEVLTYPVAESSRPDHRKLTNGHYRESTA